MKYFWTITIAMLIGISSALAEKHNIEVCEGKTVTLTASIEGTYLWSNGETGAEITVHATTIGDVQEFTCYTESEPELYNNLMKNGSFENNPPDGFQSDYTYVGYWNPNYYYENNAYSPKYSNNCWAITQNAHYFWYKKQGSNEYGFADIKPYHGNYYAIFDAGKSGDAWRATTVENPGLKLKKDTTYIFSYYAAYPNLKWNDSPAKLQFVIEYDDEHGMTQRVPLTKVLDLGTFNDHKWHNDSIQWKSPCNSDYVSISVYDANSATNGNDFCLDYILFQQKYNDEIITTVRDTFYVKTVDCVEPDPEHCDNLVIAKWNNVVFVDNTGDKYTGYQWYRDGKEIPGATSQFYYSDTELSGKFMVKLTTHDGSRFFSCEQDFSVLPHSADIATQRAPQRVRVYNMSGELQFEGEKNTHRLRPGCYIVQLIEGNQTITTHKLIIP